MTVQTKHAPADAARTAEIKVIQTARRALALTEDSYRGVISRLSGGRTDSSAKLTAAERRKVIEYFRSIGFGAAMKAKTPAQRRADYRPQAMKLKALWYSLWQLGVVEHPEQEALEAFVCRHTTVKVMKWNDAQDLQLAIECLKAWALRYGWKAEPFLGGDLQVPQEGSFKPGLIEAQWERLTALGAFRNGSFARLDTWLRNALGLAVSAPWFLEDDAAEEVIKRLGHWIRKVVRESGDPTEGDGDGPKS